MTILCIILTVIFTIGAFFLYRKSKCLKSVAKRCIVAFLAIVFLAVGLEVSLFNFNFYNTRGLEAFERNDTLYKNNEADEFYTLLSEDIIEIENINEKLHNVKISLSSENEGTVTARLYLTDEANEYYYSTPSSVIYNGVAKSEYINLHTSGKTENIRIKLESTVDQISLDGISFNEERELEFSLVRVLVLMSALFIVLVFAPSSEIYKIKLSSCKGYKSTFFVGFMALQCIFFMIIGTLNPAFVGIKKTEEGIVFAPLLMENHNQYDDLAIAVLKGKTYIDNDDVPQSLKDMENPYDTTARSYQSMLTGENYRWDVAFFQGHYYVYFGIVPLLLMYLPCRAIFNVPFPTFLGVIAFATIFAIGVFKLLNLICEKYFKNVSAGVFLLVAFSMVNCSAMFLVKRPDFYGLPIICSMAFIVWGMYMWLKGREALNLSGLYLSLGSLFCALAVGCRPQAVLVSICALPIFGEYFFKEKKMFTRDGIKRFALLAIPYIVIASGIMYYNYIRFNSPFDFGAAYNLTTNDVTRRGFDVGRTGLGLFTYLFQPPKITAVFPYISSADIVSAYMGKTIVERCFGGFITSLPIMWFVFAIGKVYSVLKEKKLNILTVFLLVVSVVMVILNTQAGGLLQRYFSDFGYLLFLVTAMVIFGLYEKNNSAENTKNLNTLLYISTIFSVLYTIGLVFSVSDGTIDSVNPTLFGEIKHLVEFWL